MLTLELQQVALFAKIKRFSGSEGNSSRQAGLPNILFQYMVNCNSIQSHHRHGLPNYYPLRVKITTEPYNTCMIKLAAIYM